MARGLSDTAVRDELLNRLARLSPDATPRWGRMNSAQMLAHLVDWMAMAEGSLVTAPIGRVLRLPLLKQLAIYWLPFPRNVQTAPELLRNPRDWSIERETLRERLQRFQSLTSRTDDWPEHPVFGSMTARAWCVFAYRHMDHHFRQFGI